MPSAVAVTIEAFRGSFSPGGATFLAAGTARRLGSVPLPLLDFFDHLHRTEYQKKWSRQCESESHKCSNDCSERENRKEHTYKEC